MMHMIIPKGEAKRLMKVHVRYVCVYVCTFIYMCVMYACMYAPLFRKKDGQIFHDHDFACMHIRMLYAALQLQSIFHEHDIRMSILHKIMHKITCMCESGQDFFIPEVDTYIHTYIHTLCTLL